MKNCLIIDDMHLSITGILSAGGINAVYRPDITREEILSIIHLYEGIIVRSKIRIDNEILNKALRLKYIARAGAGKDNIDLETAAGKGIAILNAPEGNRDAVAEHVIGMILNLLNNINLADAEVRKGLWRREANRGTELAGKKVGIIGFGNTGREVARRIKCFGCVVLAFDIHHVNETIDGVMLTDLEEIFRETDILTLHVPLDKHNFQLVNSNFISRFSKPFWLINSARGEIINTTDLITGLKTGKILGAGLDVLENEKFSQLTEKQKHELDVLCGFPNVIFTPHVAGWTFESYEKISQTLGSKILSFYNS